MLHELVYETHPFDVVGWDGYNYPYGFSIHNFEKAKEILEAGMKTPIKQPVISWNARYLLLKCYFELRELESFENLIESTRQFLSRNQGTLRGVFQKGQNSLRAFRLLYRIENHVGEAAGKRELWNEIRDFQAKGKIMDPWFIEKSTK